MTRRACIPRVTTVAIVFAVTLLTSAWTSNAQDCRLVMIHSGFENVTDSIVIEPDTVWASKNTCVIWSNWIKGQEVRIIFEEGEKCETPTDAARGFELDEAKAYVSLWLPTGGTSSLKFNEEGSFEYLVEVKNGLKAKGKIIIR